VRNTCPHRAFYDADKIAPFLFSYIPVEITIHANGIFAGLITLATCSTITSIIDHPASPAAFVAAVYSIETARAAGQTPSALALLPSGPKPHCMKFQQLSPFFISAT
jgi:hypothetical protein